MFVIFLIIPLVVLYLTCPVTSKVTNCANTFKSMCDSSIGAKRIAGWRARREVSETSFVSILANFMKTGNLLLDFHADQKAQPKDLPHKLELDVHEDPARQGVRNGAEAKRAVHSSVKKRVIELILACCRKAPPCPCLH